MLWQGDSWMISTSGEADLKGGKKMKKKMQIINQYNRTLDFDEVVNIMDDDLRERVHRCAPISDQQFFDIYCELHKKIYGDEFDPNKRTPQF